jgi:hypothetical protein
MAAKVIALTPAQQKQIAENQAAVTAAQKAHTDFLASLVPEPSVKGKTPPRRLQRFAVSADGSSLIVE